MKVRSLALAATLISTLALAAPIDDAIQAMDAGRHDEAARKLAPLADSGVAEAQYRLGLLYYTGKGVSENEKQAYELLLKSAKQGHQQAMFHLGNLLAFGQDAARIVADPDAEAARWYFQAASAGHAEAQYSLAILFLTGKGVERNDKEATYWMQQAAKNGHKEAQGYLSAGKKGR
jgi:uncharacterized protein